VTHFYSGCIAIELKLPKHTREVAASFHTHASYEKVCC